MLQLNIKFEKKFHLILLALITFQLVLGFYSVPNKENVLKLLKLLKLRQSSVAIVNIEVMQAPKRSYYGEAKILCSAQLLGENGVLINLKYPDLPWHEMFAVRVGDRLQVLALIEPLLLDEADPFNYRSYLLRRGYLAEGEIIKVNKYLFRAKNQNKKEEFIKNIIKRYQATPELAVTLASTIGYDSLIDEETNGLFKQTGLMHLIVVSGYHVAIIYTVIYFILSFVFRRSYNLIVLFPYLRLVLLISLILIYYYINLVGQEITTIRALIAIFLFILGRFFGKKQNNINAYLFIFFLILIIWPQGFFEVGFQLTFAALLGLIFAAKVSKITLFKIRRPWKMVINHIYFSLFPLCFTAPIIYFWFDTFAARAFFYNLLFTHIFCLIFILFAGLNLLFIFLGLGQYGVYYLFELNLYLARSFILIISLLENSFQST